VGVYTVALSLAGYQARTEQVSVVAGGTSAIAVELDPLQRVAIRAGADQVSAPESTVTLTGWRGEPHPLPPLSGFAASRRGEPGATRDRGREQGGGALAAPNLRERGTRIERLLTGVESLAGTWALPARRLRPLPGPACARRAGPSLAIPAGPGSRRRRGGGRATGCPLPALAA
jgi:hypothetical protein